MRRDPADVVVFGHSHKPFDERMEGIWYFNPGSAGPRRFRLPISIGRLSIENGVITPELVRIG